MLVSNSTAFNSCIQNVIKYIEQNTEAVVQYIEIEILTLKIIKIASNEILNHYS